MNSFELLALTEMKRIGNRETLLCGVRSISVGIQQNGRSRKGVATILWLSLSVSVLE